MEVKEKKRLEAEKARLIMENLGWEMSKMEFTPSGITMQFEKEIQEKKE